MQIDPAQQSAESNYKLLTNLIVPRPIAWVTSCNREGLVNLAPFSFFNALGADPVYIAFSIGLHPEKRPKDTAVNILERGEFVVNLVTEALLDAMNISAIDFPPEISELEAAGLTPAPSVHIRVPRLAEAPVSLECKLHQTLTLGTNTIVIGEVVMFHVADPLVGPRLRIVDFAPIGRLGSPSMYCRTTDRFNLPRISYADWQEKG